LINLKRIDYHVHSNNSFDAKFGIIQMCKSAELKGISEICFTEHFNVDSRDVSYNFLNYNKYSEEILEAREIFSGKLDVKKGLEIGEPHILRKKLSDELSMMDLDFIIGSVHNINGLKLRLYMQNKNKKSVYKDYFDEVLRMVENSDIDIVGHLDLMKRYAYDIYGDYKFDDYREIIEEILKKIIQKDIGIEVNTSGLRNKVGKLYPSIDVLKLYKNIGGKIITIGSDSHDLDNIGNNFLTVVKMLKKIGFEYIYRYKNRKKLPVRIEI
jgi:histidinol-phosphatase (PHP family)